MNPDPTLRLSHPVAATPPAPPIPLDQLALEVYESAPAEVQNRMLTQLVGRVYASAPPPLQSRLLEHLLRPLGVLSLVAVANGIFAKIWLRNGGQHLYIRLEDTQDVKASDVADLVDQVQQVSLDAVNGLAQILTTSPLMTGSAAVAVLATLLLRRARLRRAEDSNANGFQRI